MSADWPSKTLAEVCEIKPPKSEAKRKLKDADLVSFVPMEDLGIDQKVLEPKAERKLGQVAGSYTYFADGDVLLAKITPCFENGKLGIARGLTNGIGFGSSEYIVFRPREELSNEYLYYFLSQDSFRADGVKTMSGAVGHKRVSKEFVESSQIPLPSLPEQRRIVAILDEAFAGLATATANAEKNLKNARELFEGVLHSAMTGKIASDGGVPAEHSGVPSDEHSAIKDSEIPFVIPANWRWCRFGSVVEFFNGDRGKNYPNKREYVSAGVPWINTGHIREGGLLDTETMNFITRKKFDSLNGGKIESGDLVYCLRGATIGKTAFVDPYSEGAVASSLMIIRPGPAIHRRFAYYFLISRLGRQLIKRFDNGAAQPNLGGASVAKYVTPLPPLEIQKGIVRALDALAERRRALEAIYYKRLGAFEDLKRSILQKAFSGELTSPPSRTIKEAAE